MDNITCYGAGVIGTAWAVVFLRAGMKVCVYDLNDAILEKAKQNMDSIFAFFTNEGLMDEDQVADCLSRVRFTCDVRTAVENADLIQESCPEKLDIKQSVIKTIEKFTRPNTIICSSTSGIPISDIARNAVHKERIIGGHPYNPVYLIPLIELTKGDFASDEVVVKAKDFYLSIGKQPIVLNQDCLGFVCNRLQVALVREAYDLCNRGVVSVEDVDKAVVYSIGLRWALLGPHLTAHVGGGEGGIKYMMEHVNPHEWYEDMAKWTEFPKGYSDKAAAGVAAAMAHRAPGTGQTNEELLNYMNKGIIQILKYHGLLK